MSHTDIHRQQRGSLLIEALIAISILSIFTISAFSLVWSVRILDSTLEQTSLDITRARKLFDDIHSIFKPWNISGIDSVWAGDDTFSISTSTSHARTEVSDTDAYFGRSYCSPIFDTSRGRSIGGYHIERNQNLLPTGVHATDIRAHHGKIYLTGDSSVQAKPDMYIYDMSHLITSLHTGPGTSGIAIAGHYAYSAQLSSVSQVHVIDMIDRTRPSIITSLKLPLPDASSTAPYASSIYYAHSRIYIGTEKWNGPEFVIVDVTDPLSPVYLGGYEVNAMVSAIVVRDDRAYIATADSAEYQVLDIHDPNAVTMIDSFTPPGWQIESGNSVYRHHGITWFGRAGGGFNTSQYRELFGFGSTTVSTHIEGGVYGIVIQEPYVFVAAGGQGGGSAGEIQIWNIDLTQKLLSIPLSTHPTALACDRDDLYVAVDDPTGFIQITFI